MEDDLSAFNIVDATYKVVCGRNIDLSILTIKDLIPGKYPLVVRFHGGLLITGARLYVGWVADWLQCFLSTIPCICITADYRLLPEADGCDIIADISDLWKWITKDLPSVLGPSGFEADLTRILTVGESAGAYMAIQSALLFPEMNVKAVISQYGLLDLKSRFFTETYEKSIRGCEMYDPKELDDHIEAVKDGKLPKVVTGAIPPRRRRLAYIAVQQGLLPQMLGCASKIYPMENLERVKKPPAIWLLHGSEDSAVPAAGSKVFAAKLKKLHPNAAVLLTIQRGEHGFESIMPPNTPWIAQGLDFISKHWLASTCCK